MKSSILIFTLIVNASVWGQTKSSDGLAGGVIINESMQKLLDVDGVKSIYDSCARNNTGTNETSVERTGKVFDCVWKDVSKNAALKKKVMDAYSAEAKADKNGQAAIVSQGGRAPASADASAKPKDSSNLLTKNDNLSVDYTNDPAVVALSEFYMKKLDEVLDPDKALSKDDAKKGMIVSTDHKKFIELYKSELGKTIINAFTSYCMDADPDQLDCLPNSDPKIKDKWDCSDAKAIIGQTDDQRKTYRDKNLKSLKKASFADDSQEAAKWKKCISNVSPNCKPGTNTETSKRACLIVDYVQSARKNIMVADAQLKDYKELDSSLTMNVVANTQAVDPKKLSSDTLLQITSDDVDSSLKDPMKKETAAFEACYKNDQVVDAKACEKYLSTNDDANAKALVELSLRQEVNQDKLTEELKSTDKVREYLKAEGYSDNDIQKMTGDPNKVAATSKEILDRYKAKKEAIIAEMKAKIESKSAGSDGKIDTAGDKTNLDKIKDELASRSDDLKNLVQFNNVVASYLSISDSSGNTVQRNTASLFAEVESMKSDDKKEYDKQIKAANLSDNKKTNTSTVDLNVNSINGELIKYSTQPTADEKKKP